jgi:hypothetical protein
MTYTGAINRKPVLLCHAPIDGVAFRLVCTMDPEFDRWADDGGVCVD